MISSSINQKGIHDYLDILELHIFIWSAKTLLKTSNNVPFFPPTSPILFFPNLWNSYKFLIKKINLIVFINASLLYKI